MAEVNHQGKVKLCSSTLVKKQGYVMHFRSICILMVKIFQKHFAFLEKQVIYQTITAEISHSHV